MCRIFLIVFGVNINITEKKKYIKHEIDIMQKLQLNIKS